MAATRRAAAGLLLGAMLALLGGCGSLPSLATAPIPLTLAGTVRDSGGPIVGAQVRLTAYEHERCVSLARSAARPTQEDREALRECVRMSGEAVTDEAGRYAFANVRPGSYDVTIVWTLRPGQPVPSDPVFQQGPFAMVIVRNREGTWTVTVRSEIVALPEQWDAIQDFAFQPPDR